MPAEFDKIVDAIKKSLRKRYPKMKDDDINSKAYAIAVSIWKDKYGTNPFEKKEEEKEKEKVKIHISDILFYDNENLKNLSLRQRLYYLKKLNFNDKFTIQRKLCNKNDLDVLLKKHNKLVIKKLDL